jgi:hypothetical protein
MREKRERKQAKKQARLDGTAPPPQDALDGPDAPDASDAPDSPADPDHLPG